MLLGSIVDAELRTRPEIRIGQVLTGRTSVSEKENWLPMNWALHESQVRFDIRAEREECERLFKHPARVLQDRLARCGGTDRTRRPGIPEWKRACLKEEEYRRLLHQASVLGWGKEKRFYYAHKAPI